MLSPIFPFLTTSIIFVLVSIIIDRADAQDTNKGQKNELAGELNSNIVSYSSCLIAASRAIESERSDALVVDPLAKTLSGSAYEYRKKHTTKTTWRIAIRTRYFDDHIRSFLQQHHSKNKQEQEQQQTVQVVHLGAGMDSRAYRLEEANDDTIFYDVDCPEVLELKAKLLLDLKEKLLLSTSTPTPTPSSSLPELKVEETENDLVISSAKLQEMIIRGDKRRRTLSCNLEENGWEEHLLKAGFDTSRPTCWVLEGLTYYLPDDAVVSSMFQTMRRLSTKGSCLIVSISSKHGVRRAKKSHNKLMQSWKWGTDEPIKFLTSIDSGGWECTSTDVVTLGDERANYGRFPEQDKDQCHHDGDVEPRNSKRSEISYVIARC